MLYFAYGSNLWLDQMASRCPNSHFVGRAILPDYRWQINQRGFANVTECSGYSVHGLIYQIDEADEARLDRNEGVNSGAYSKRYLSVILHEAARSLRTRDIVQGGWPAVRLPAAAARRRGSTSTSELAPRLEPYVLVYLSERFVEPGIAREEYVTRMNYGIRDALLLGVPEDFLQRFLRKHIPPRRLTPERERDGRSRPASRTPNQPREKRRAHSVSLAPRSRRTEGDEASPPRVRTVSPPRYY